MTTFNPYSFDRVQKTAERMLKRYSLARVANEMAHWHACDSVDVERIAYWRAVAARITSLSTRDIKC